MKKHIHFFFILMGCLAFNHAAAQVNYKWVKGLSSGLPGQNTGKSITVDNLGFVYVTGTLARGNDSANFNPYGNGPVSLLNDKGGNCFFAKYDSVGNCLWAKKLDLFAIDPLLPVSAGLNIVVDGSYNVYIVGAFKDSVDFDPASGSNLYKMKSTGSSDCFLARYNSLGEFVWAKQFGGTGFDLGTGITIDDFGTGVYITGFYTSSLAYFKGSSGVEFTLNNAGGKDIFLAKYGTDGTFNWAKGIGGLGDDIGTAIDANSSYVTLTGSFQDTVDFNSGGTTPYKDTALGDTDIFLAKYLLDGTFGWELNIGYAGIGNVGLGTAVKIDDIYSKIYLAGNFEGIMDFNLSNPYVDSASAIGQRDIFLAKYNLGDGMFEWKNTFGSSIAATDTATATNIAVDQTGNYVYLTGGFEGEVNFDPQGANILDSKGEGDIFFAKYMDDGSYAWARKMGSAITDIAYGIAVHNSESVYLIGNFKDTVDFDPTDGTAVRANSHNFGTAMFIAKYSLGTSVIAGTVTRNGGIPITAGKVKLYTQTINDGNAVMHLMDIFELYVGGGGMYSFSGVCTGSYIVLAMPDASDLPSTYHGSATHWQQATSVVTSINSSHTANILINQLSPFTGNATLSGKVLEGSGYDRIAGTPISGTDVGLEGDPNGIIAAHTITDSSGHYEFNYVPAGCYKIYVNIPGLPMDSTYHECPTELDSILNLNFVADSSGIDINPVTTSVEQISTLKTKLQIYPNPHKGTTTIEFTIIETNRVQINVYNLLGEKVTALMDEQKQSGTIKCRFNAADKGLKPGIYLLNVKIGNESNSKKIIQIE